MDANLRFNECVRKNTSDARVASGKIARKRRKRMFTLEDGLGPGSTVLEAPTPHCGAKGAAARPRQSCPVSQQSVCGAMSKVPRHSSEGTIQSCLGVGRVERLVFAPANF